jgi:hypothetical protein
MTTYYETMTDAEQALAALLAESAVTPDDRSVADAYDLDALGDEVIEVIMGGPASPDRYALLEDEESFWAAVERHAR